MKNLLILIPFLFVSCAGYKVSSRKNPFEVEGIRSIAIPMFTNKTVISSASPIFTRRIYDQLSKFTDLKVRSGDITNEDAVLVGIITTPSKTTETIQFTGKTLLSDTQIDAIGKRNAFPIPTGGVYDLDVEIYILKKPTKQELEFFMSYFKFARSAFPRTIFSKTFRLTGSYSIENNVGDLDSGAPVKGVKNKGIQRKSVYDVGDALAKDFREVLINAF